MNETKENRSDFLFSEPNFWAGLGSVLNISGNYYLYNYSDSDEEADLKALESDWEIVSQDLRKILKSNSPQKVSELISNE